MGRDPDGAPRWRAACRFAGLLLLAAAAASPLASPRADEALPLAVARFAADAARLVDRHGVTAYTTESGAPGSGAAPDVHLDRPRPKAFTDCSGWVGYLLASVSPLHQAVLARHRLAPVFNDGVLDEAAYAWARAFVVRDYLARQPSDAGAAEGGFQRIDDVRRLAPGDVVAWCLGGWCRPRKLTEIPPGDTGHVFVVAGRPKRIDPDTRGYRGVFDGVATLDAVPGRRVTGVVEVPVVDSSSVPHFLDSRSFGPVPDEAPPGALPGGLGSGRIWIGHDAAGAPVQFRFSRRDPYFPNKARPQAVRFAAGRPLQALSLGGDLAVARYPDAADRLAGRPYGAPDVRVTGEGALQLEAGAPLTLAAASTFAGPVTVAKGAELFVATDAALGAWRNPVHLLGRLTLADGFAGAAGRRLVAEPTGVLATPGDATWRGPLSGRTLAVDAAGRLTLSAIGRTVHGRRTLRLP